MTDDKSSNFNYLGEEFGSTGRCRNGPSSQFTITLVPWLPLYRCRIRSLHRRWIQAPIMSTVAITSSPQSAALPQRGRILMTMAQTTWSVTIALGAVVIGCTTLSFTLAHIGVNSLAFHFAPISHYLSRICREA